MNRLANLNPLRCGNESWVGNLRGLTLALFDRVAATCGGSLVERGTPQIGRAGHRRCRKF